MGQAHFWCGDALRGACRMHVCHRRLPAALVKQGHTVRRVLLHKSGDAFGRGTTGALLVARWAFRRSSAHTHGPHDGLLRTRRRHSIERHAHHGLRGGATHCFCARTFRNDGFMLAGFLRGPLMATPDDHGTREEGADGAGIAAAASRSLDASGRKQLLQCAPFSVPAHAHFLRKALAICDPELAIGALHVARREAESAENSASTVELCDSAFNILLLCDVRASVERPGQLVRTSAAAGKRRRAHMRSSGWSDTLRCSKIFLPLWTLLQFTTRQLVTLKCHLVLAQLVARCVESLQTAPSPDRSP
jgi:hypothetical protein